jgi:dTDP-4-amino-4,6-dideoxygalactose transaminase
MATPGNSIIREFEYKIGEFTGAPFVIATCNATIAILGVIHALGIRNCEVLTTPLTWPGSLTGFSLLNNQINFADVEPDFLTISPASIEARITKNTKAVFTSDFLGYPCRLDLIKEICIKHKILLIHDSASSFGSIYKNFYSGKFADIAIFSFGTFKTLKLGEGGCIVVNNPNLVETLISSVCHPDVQSLYLEDINPFFIKTAINPMAAEKGVKTIDMVLNKVERRKRKVKNFLLRANIPSPPNDSDPNFNNILVKFKDIIYNKNISSKDLIQPPCIIPIYSYLNYNYFFKGPFKTCKNANEAVKRFCVIKY